MTSPTAVPPSIVAVAPDDARAVAALQRYFAELAERLPEGFDPGDALLAAQTSFAAPGGCFLLAVDGGSVLGCVALQLLGGRTAEVKRMWVDPQARGSGIGSALLRAVEQHAVAAGCLTLVLDTHASLVEAIALYERHGFAEVAAYNDNPYAQRWFGKQLA